MPKRNRNFFKLQESCEKICKAEDLFELTKIPNKTVENILYHPDELDLSKIEPRPRIKKIVGITFKNVSFTKTRIKSIVFRDCKFEECLFIGSQFEHCEFHDCKFIDTNTHKIDFINVYIDPHSFKDCLSKDTHQNIGTHLYQRLMHNASRENQRSFGRRAAFSFNTWRRYQWLYEFKKSKNFWKSADALLAWFGRLIWGFFGAGVHFGWLAFSFTFILLILSITNFFLHNYFGLSEIENFIDSIYFTVITLTTIGYGDITPTSTIGKVAIIIEGILGYGMFATAASIMIRRIEP